MHNYTDRWIESDMTVIYHTFTDNYIYICIFSCLYIHRLDLVIDKLTFDSGCLCSSPVFTVTLGTGVDYD